MYSLLILAVLLGVGLLALRLWRGERLRRLALERIGLEGEDDFMAPAVTAVEPEVVRPYPRRYYWVPPAAGILVAVLVLWGTGLPRPYALGFGVLVTAIASLLEIRLADRSRETIESQLADAIDLMVASLQAGSALLAALEATLREARRPMREELQSIIARIRVGEDPRSVVRQLARRVPTESFRLFCHALLVHWETGGSLTSSLRTVGGTIRDRLEVSRRINSQAVESQVSVVAVMAITYGLVVFMLYQNPVQFKKLIYSAFGSSAAAALMMLQAAGMVWIWRMSRIRF